MGQTGGKVRDTKSRQHFSQRMHPIHPNGPKTHIFVRFILFWCSWDCLVGSQKMMENVQNWCESSCHEVQLEHFATNAHDPPHWTLNSCFGAFRTIWMHLGPFGCLKKLEAKRVKLVQKFVPRSLVGILATNTPDPPDWTLNSCFGVFRIIWVHLGLFGCVTTLSVKRVKLVKKFVPWSPIGIFRNKRNRSAAIGP